MSLKKNAAAYVAEYPAHRDAVEAFAAWCGARRPKAVPTLDQLARRAEFERLFQKIGCKNKTAIVAEWCGVSVQTVRIWRCESAHRFPSWEHIKKLENGIKEFKK